MNRPFRWIAACLLSVFLSLGTPGAVPAALRLGGRKLPFPGELRGCTSSASRHSPRTAVLKDLGARDQHPAPIATPAQS